MHIFHTGACFKISIPVPRFIANQVFKVTIINYWLKLCLAKSVCQWNGLTFDQMSVAEEDECSMFVVNCSGIFSMRNILNIFLIDGWMVG